MLAPEMIQRLLLACEWLRRSSSPAAVIADLRQQDIERAFGALVSTDRLEAKASIVFLAGLGASALAVVEALLTGESAAGHTASHPGSPDPATDFGRQTASQVLLTKSREEGQRPLPFGSSALRAGSGEQAERAVSSSTFDQGDAVPSQPPEPPPESEVGQTASHTGSPDPFKNFGRQAAGQDPLTKSSRQGQGLSLPDTSALWAGPEEPAESAVSDSTFDQGSEAPRLSPKPAESAVGQTSSLPGFPVPRQAPAGKHRARIFLTSSVGQGYRPPATPFLGQARGSSHRTLFPFQPSIGDKRGQVRLPSVLRVHRPMAKAGDQSFSPVRSQRHALARLCSSTRYSTYGYRPCTSQLAC